MTTRAIHNRDDAAAPNESKKRKRDFEAALIDDGVWLLESTIESYPGMNKRVEITLPEWLAEKHGLV